MIIPIVRLVDRQRSFNRGNPAIHRNQLWLLEARLLPDSLVEVILHTADVALGGRGVPAPSEPAAKKRTFGNQVASTIPASVFAPAPEPQQTFAPGSKDQRLYELLGQSKSDKLTPLEYHAQRAKILAEP